MTEQEIFVPTFELVLHNRNHRGEVVDAMTSYSATTGQGVAACLFKHNKKFPRPRKKKKAETPQ
jgi:hypothetical protein